MVPERLEDEEWKSVVLAIGKDFARVGEAKSDVFHSFEKYNIFQNKFVSLAGLCAELHGSNSRCRCEAQNSSPA